MKVLKNDRIIFTLVGNWWDLNGQRVLKSPFKIAVDQYTRLHTHTHTHTHAHKHTHTYTHRLRCWCVFSIHAPPPLNYPFWKIGRLFWAMQKLFPNMQSFVRPLEKWAASSTLVVISFRVFSTFFWRRCSFSYGFIQICVFGLNSTKCPLKCIISKNKFYRCKKSWKKCTMCTTVTLQMCRFAFPVQCVSFSVQAPHTAALTKLDKKVSERITKSSFIQSIYKNNSVGLKGKIRIIKKNKTCA